MKLILTSILGLVALLTAPVAFAQNRVTFQGLTAADDFAYGIANGSPALLVLSGSNTSGTYALTLVYGQGITGSGLKFTAFSTSAPITVGVGASLETVTPSSVSCTTPAVYGTCTVTATFANAHGNGDLVRSGDYGLEEAAGFVVGQGGGLVVLSPHWFQLAGGHSAGLTFLLTFKSLATTTYSVLDYSGVAGALSYAAASGSNYASTTHVIY